VKQGNRMLPKGARRSGSRDGDTCAIDEIKASAHESRRREPTEAYKGEKTKRRKEEKGIGHEAVLSITFYFI
jgi:hypothetical protein